jgi:putative DNA primase/helicase
MVGAAAKQAFHPVRDYLASLQWDGVPRIGSWLADVFGAAIDPYHHAVGSKFLQAAVRRVRRPGCKFDNILVLEGPQDIGKSRACRILFGADWFTDNLPTDLSGRDISDALQGIWGVEFAEIEHLLRATPEAFKAFLSREVDRFRAPYGRQQVERPRQCVFIGTTNSDDYARDSTGNRRLWPVKCHGKVNTEYLRDNRDLLWAEAAATEPSANLWLDDDAIADEARRQQNERREEDPWESGILKFLVTAGSAVLIPDILTNHLQLTKDRQDKRAQMRVAAILRRAGWKRIYGRLSGELGRFWERPP